MVSVPESVMVMLPIFSNNIVVLRLLTVLVIKPTLFVNEKVVSESVKYDVVP